MGGVMLNFLRSATIVAAVIWSGCGAHAQPDPRWLTTDPKVVEAARTLRGVIELASGSIAATEFCKIGDDKGWLAVVGTVERRYANCVQQDPGWTALSQSLDKEREEAKAKRYPTGAPWLLFMRAMNGAQHEADTMGIAAYCASQPWQLISDPTSLSAKQLADYKRDNPTRNIDYDIALITSMLALGKDAQWTDAPCDKLFWPPGFPPRKP
jgi:hypothetical protein